MAHELSENELVMLDALTYYSQLSDKYTKAEGSPYRKIIDFVDDAINSLQTDNKYETCFNDLISDEKNGMVDILKLVKQNPRLTRLEIVYLDGFKDDDEKYKWKKDDTSSVCLVDPITKDVYVIFGGNYSAENAHYKGKDMYTWVENALGAAQKDNLEQLNGLDFYHDITS